MELKINKDSCIGCGACVGLCDEIFEFGDDGLAEVKENPIPEEFEEDAQDALEGCPTSAIENLEE